MKREKPTSEVDEDLAQVVTGHGPCTYLLLALLGLILVHPYAKGDAVGRIVLAILYSMVLVGGAYAIGRNRRALIVSFGLAAVGVALQCAALVSAVAAIYQLAAVA